MNSIILSADHYSAEIVPEIGGNCIRLENTAFGADLLRTPPDEESLRAKPVVYGMPLLFPAGRIRDGRFTFRDRIYELPINEPSRHNHLNGFLYDQPFEMIHHSKDSAVLQFVWKAEVSFFPHPFVAERKYHLSAAGLIHEVSFINTGSEVMPFSIGFHTAFNLPFIHSAKAEDVCLSAGIEHRILLDSERFLPAGLENPDDDCCKAIRVGRLSPAHSPLSFYGKLSSNRMLLHDTQTGLQLQYDIPGFPFCVLWNGGGDSGFICMEPQSCMPDAFNQLLPPKETGVLMLLPGQKISRKQRVVVQRLEWPTTEDLRERALYRRY